MRFVVVSLTGECFCPKVNGNGVAWVLSQGLFREAKGHFGVHLQSAISRFEHKRRVLGCSEDAGVLLERPRVISSVVE